MQKIYVQIGDFMLFCESKGLSKKTMASYEQIIKLYQTHISYQ